MFKQIPRVLLALTLGVLAACASKPPQGDYGPTRPVDVSHIKDAEPKLETRTRAGNKSPYTVLGETYTLLPDSEGFRQTGIASWYGYKFHGRKTANGEVYDMYKMTAAHKTLPIPSYVRVTNQSNGRSVIVRVNDRGPFHEGRVIDLSYSAAQKLDFIGQGTAKVAVEAISTGASRINVSGAKATSAAVAKPAAVNKKRYLQLASFKRPEAAENLRRQLQQLVKFPVRISRSQTTATHRVQIGPIVGGAQQIEAIYRDVVGLKLGTGFLVTE